MRKPRCSGEHAVDGPCGCEDCEACYPGLVRQGDLVDRDDTGDFLEKVCENCVYQELEPDGKLSCGYWGKPTGYRDTCEFFEGMDQP